MPGVRILIFLLCFKLTFALGAEQPGRTAQSPGGAESAGKRAPALVAPGASSTNVLAALDDLSLLERRSRFLPRVDQRVAYVAELLKTEQFEFTSNDRYYIDRRKAPYPKDLDEAKRLWRLHLRYEYLQEKLNLERPKVADATRPRTKERKNETNAAPVNARDEIIQTLTRRYQRILRFWTLEEDGGDVLQFYLTALMNVYDPPSDYLGKSTFEH